MSGNLDRIQIVKVWVDAAGKRQEKVFDAVWSGDRKPGADGKLPKVGNTVDVANATWTNTIGSPELITVWTDPEFDPKVSAAYYARVLEIPTPRWTAYEAKRPGILRGVSPPADVPMDYEEFASGLPLDRTTVFTSAEENEETMRRLGVNQRVRQLGRGKFRSDLAVLSTEQGDLFSDRFNRACSMFLEPPPGTVGLVFPRSAGGQFLASGEERGR